MGDEKKGLGEMIQQAIEQAVMAAIPAWLPEALKVVADRAFEAAASAYERTEKDGFEERVREALGVGEDNILTSNDFDMGEFVKSDDLPDFDDFVKTDAMIEALADVGMLEPDSIVTTEALTNPASFPDVMDALAHALARSPAVQAVLAQTIEAALRQHGLLPAPLSPVEVAMVLGPEVGASPADADAARADREAGERPDVA